MLRLRQQATLQTRPTKQAYSLAELMTSWRRRATDVLSLEGPAGDRAVVAEVETASFVAALAGRNKLPLLRAADLSGEVLSEVGSASVRAVAEKRATFSRLNVLAEVLRQTHGVRFASPDDRMRAAEQAVVLGSARALLISAPEVAFTPEAFRREDGTSRFRPRGAGGRPACPAAGRGWRPAVATPVW